MKRDALSIDALVRRPEFAPPGILQTGDSAELRHRIRFLVCFGQKGSGVVFRRTPQAIDDCNYKEDERQASGSFL